MKIDAVPGIDTHLRSRRRRNGEYPVVCAELCGLGHAAMRQTAHVVEPAEFDSWLEERAAGGAGGGGGERDRRRRRRAPDGKTVFTDERLRRLPRAGRRRHDRRRPARTSTRSSRARTRRSSSRVDRRPDGRDRARASRTGIMPPNFGDTLQPAELDALVKYLAEVTK